MVNSIPCVKLLAHSACVLWLLLALAGCRAALPGPNSAPGAEIRWLATPEAAPDAALPQLGGEPATLAAWRGQPLIVNFWASWCEPCRDEMALLAATHQAGHGVAVVGVNFIEDEATARAFADAQALPFPILLDQHGLLAGPLGVKALPTTFFLNADGQIVATHLGPLDAATLDAAVARLVER